MNVVRVSTRPTYRSSGMGLHPFKITESMSDVNTIYVYPKNESDNIEFNNNDNVKEVEVPFHLEKRDPKVGFIGKLSFTARRVFNVLKFNLSVINRLKKEKVDIVHIHSPMYFVIAFYYWLRGSRCYITYHGSDLNAVQNSRVYKVLSKIFSGAFSISPNMVERLQKFHKAPNLYVTNNAIDVNSYSIDNALPRQKILLAVGSLKVEKGFNMLIDAFSNAKKDNLLSGYKLHIAGEGPLHSELSRKIVNLGLEDDVFLLGHLDKEGLLEAYNRSEVFVLSSISEGFPKVLLEAMVCNLKILATDVGAVRTTLPGYKYIVSPNEESLRKGLIDIVSDAVDYNFDTVISQYSDWSKVSEKYKEIYFNDNAK
ncbi:glycosyltransferase family 4 protein [Enterovibrio sp. Hal110]